MARILPQSIASMRHLLLALVALGLVLRMGAGCEAMATTSSLQISHQVHCADVPTRPAKPVKHDMAACALSITLPTANAAKVNSVRQAANEPVVGTSGGLAGTAAGPAPPPPRTA